jgi:transcriptional regulator with XRE-family HTH domain
VDFAQNRGIIFVKGVCKYMVTFGQRLKQLRLEHEITLDKLAEELGTTRATLSHYEKGQRTPNSEIIKSISKYFGVTADFLLGNFTTLAKLVDYIRLNRTFAAFAELTGVNEDLLIKICGGQIEDPPAREVLKKIYNADPDAQAIVSFEELLEAAGYLDSKTALSMRKRGKEEKDDCIILYSYAQELGLTPDEAKEAMEFVAKVKKKT